MDLYKFQCQMSHWVLQSCFFFIREFDFFERALDWHLVCDHLKQVWLLAEMLSDIMMTDFRVAMETQPFSFLVLELYYVNR